MISPLVLWPSFQSPALSRLAAVNRIRIWTEIQLPHGRCQRISREGRDGETNATGDKSSGYENLCNVPQRPMMVLVHKEKRMGGTSNPELWAQLHAQATQGQTSLGETAGPQLWPQARSGYPSVSTGLSYLPHVLLCLMPPRKHLPGYMYPQPSSDVPKSQVPV